MAFFSPANDLPAALMHEEPFRFTRKLPLILTKLTPPRSPGALLPRERLLQRLDGATSSSLTLVCAAAGFGKTTLLAQWYRHRQQRGDLLAWLSLEEEDSTPLLFMRYLLEALRPLYQGWNNALPRLTDEDLPASFSSFIAELINQLHACPHPLYLILDDYQSIQHPDIHHGLSSLLIHAPCSLHLIVGSRSHPPFALGRLQMQDQLVEIYDDELRFNPMEAKAYFAGPAASSVKKEHIPQLLSVTEGWIAGMKMAALATTGDSETDPVAGSLQFSSRSVARYLEEVIFAPLPREVFDFLIHTSMLNRLHPALCDAVTGQHNAEAMLGWIEQRSLFLSALDDAGFWFRYHPLMRDALFNRLQHQVGSDIPSMHERASNWFAAQQLWAESIRHALAAGKSALKHAQAGAQSLAEEGDIDTMVRWIRYLPADVDPARIELQINLAWALAHHFHFNDARQLLDEIEQLLEQGLALTHSSWVKLRVVRAICEAFADNIARSIAIVEPLLQQVPCGDLWVDGLVCNILSYCYLAASRPQQALNVQQRVSGGNQANRNLFVEVYRALVIAQGYLRQGNLPEAEQLALRALQHAERHTGVNSSSGATLSPILAEIAWEKGDLPRIDELLTLRLNTIDDFCPPDGLSSCYIILARKAQLEGQTEKADALLQHAEQLTISRGWLRAQALILSERLAIRLHCADRDEARRLMARLQSLGETAASEKEVIGWYLGLSHSRLLLASGKLLAAANRLHPLVNQLEQRGEWLLAVRWRLLEAVILFRAGQTERAVECCRPALPRAVTQNLWRSLVDLGPDLRLLLGYLRQQQAADNKFAAAVAQLWSILPATESAGLKLTQREQQTLCLIADGHSNKAIARTLGISAETVKWHLKQLYEKLQVNGRIQAVNQARVRHLIG